MRGVSKMIRVFGGAAGDGGLNFGALALDWERMSDDAALLEKVWAGGRIDPAEARRLFRLPLEELGALADRRRQLAQANAHQGRGNGIVTYIVDRNVNYTNVCNVYCKFCAFYRTEKDADAYIITLEEMDRKIEETLALGGTQILLQGGHHPKLSLQWYLDLLSHIKTKFPQVNIHGFSPSEFVHFREVFQLPLEEIISQFVKAGLGSIPGGGGEILVDRVRRRISPLKAMSDDWLEVMDVAHRLGLASTATMMFGHVETLEDRRYSLLMALESLKCISLMEVSFGIPGIETNGRVLGFHSLLIAPKAPKCNSLMEVSKGMSVD